MSGAETPSQRAFNASASACVKTGWTSVVSILRAASAVPQLPDRNRVVRRLLVYECVSLQRRLHHLEIERLLRCEAVEHAAPHEQDLIDQNIALGAPFARIASLTEDTPPGLAPDVATPREGHFEQRDPIPLWDQPARIVARIQPNGRRAG